MVGTYKRREKNNIHNSIYKIQNIIIEETFYKTRLLMKVMEIFQRGGGITFHLIGMQS